MSDTQTINLENVTTEFKPVEVGFVTIIPESQNALAPFTPVEGTPVTVVENKPSFPTFELNPQTINLSSMGIVLANPVVVPEIQGTAPAQEASKPETTMLSNGTVVAEGETAPGVVDPITAQPIGE
jgi:hypothetical protein